MEKKENGLLKEQHFPFQAHLGLGIQGQLHLEPLKGFRAQRDPKKSQERVLEKGME